MVVEVEVEVVVVVVGLGLLLKRDEGAGSQGHLGAAQGQST